MKLFKIRKQAGFVLAVSMIFLIVMTLLAVTAMKKATLEEKIGGNLRAQNMAFQSAEKALRYCESAIVLTTGSAKMCTMRSGKESWEVPATVEFPQLWKTKDNWTKAVAQVLPSAEMSGVASAPRCMIERWAIPSDRGKEFYPYVVTARGVGSVDSAVVVLQEVIRCGSI